MPGEFHGQKNLVDYSPWSYKESDTTERLTLSLFTSRKKGKKLKNLQLGERTDRKQ